MISLRLLSSKTCYRQNNLSKYNGYLINKQDSENCTVKWCSCSTIQSSVRICLENVWSYTSCKAWCLVKHPNWPISTNTDTWHKSLRTSINEDKELTDITATALHRRHQHYYYYYYYHCCSRSSSVSIVSDYGLDDWGSIPDRGRGFFL
jgi:hypothetical protein